MHTPTRHDNERLPWLGGSSSADRTAGKRWAWMSDDERGAAVALADDLARVEGKPRRDAERLAFLLTLHCPHSARDNR